jgi:hypothetical protein
MTPKTSKDILEAVANEYARQAQAVGFTENDSFLTVTQANDQLLALMKSVIGSEVHVRHVCPPDSVNCAAFKARAQLRHAQRQALYKAFGKEPTE